MSQRNVNFSIQKKLFIWLIVLALPILIACVVTVSLVKSSLTQSVVASLENDYRLEAARIESALRHYKDIANGLANSRSIRTALGTYSNASFNNALIETTIKTAASPSEFDHFSSDLILGSLMTEISGLARAMDAGVVEFRISTLDGTLSDQTEGYSWTPTDDSIFQEVIKRRQPVFGDAFQNPDGEARLGIVVPIFSEATLREFDNMMVESISGVMSMELRLGPIVDLVEAHEGIGSTSESHIAQATPAGDAQFITLLRFERDAAFNKIIPESAQKPINEAFVSPREHVVRSPDYRNIDSFLAVGTIAETGWGLTVKIDVAEAFMPLYEVTNLIWKVGIASLLLMISSWFVLIRPLATRLQSNAVAADRLAAGEYDQLIFDAAPDEIGAVSNSIDRLATDLKEDRRLREKAEQSLKYQSEHDHLTGLFNRKHLQQVAESLDSKRSDTTFSVLSMGLDGFKAINDEHGHHIGDQILIRFSKELKLILPQGSIASRWGSDEFVVIVPSSDTEGANYLAHRISGRFEKPFVTSTGSMSLSCSIGTSTSDSSLSVADCVKHADSRMYANKQARKLESDVSVRAVTLIKSSIKNNLIDVWYQPIVAASKKSGYHIIGVEALLRIKNKSGKHLSPDKFLPHIHEHNIAIDLDDKVTSLAFEDFGQWRAQGMVGPDFYVAVNLCGATAGLDTMPALLSDKISRFGIPAKNVVVELSEQTQIIKPEMLSALKQIGVKIAIDDIGLLNSNMERLASSEADIAKFDRFWLTEPQAQTHRKEGRNIDDRKKIVLRNLIKICTHLGMECVIEGVEDRQQLSASRQIGINRFQGYLFDRPLSSEQFSSKLEHVAPSLWVNTHRQHELIRVD